MSDEQELELAGELARYIGLQAEGTRDRERLWIYAASRLIEKLLSGSATAADYARANTHLRLLDSTAGRPEPEITPAVERLHAQRRPSLRSPNPVWEGRGSRAA
jgi:hypothetical protein